VITVPFVGRVITVPFVLSVAAGSPGSDRE